MRPTPFRLALSGILATWLATASTPGAVLINEFVASASDRLLIREPGQPPRAGLPTPWQHPDFEDTFWSESPGPFGFGTLAGVTAATDTSAAMQGRVPSLYLRRTFTATSAQAAATDTLQLQIRCNDGFVAYLNGVEIARRNLGPAGTFVFHDQPAFNPDAAATAVTITLGTAASRLIAGENTLCIQAHNVMADPAHAATFLCQASLEIAGTTTTALVAAGDTWRFVVGVAEPSGGVVDHGLLRLQPTRVLWASPEFNDLTWPQGPGPVGYDTSSPADYLVGTDVRAQLHQRRTSVYTRTVFTASAAEAAAAEPLALELDYDDGVIVYLNGIEVARRNVGTAGTITPHTATATTDHGANGDGGGPATGREETLQLAAAAHLLAEGDNILAVQLHNVSSGSSDLIARVTLRTTGPSARTLVAPTDRLRYFIGERSPHGEDEGANELPDPILDATGDWIELRNTEATAVDLTGWSLTDDATKPRKWSFPAGTTIPGSGYLVVMATELGLGPADGTSYLHAGFKLGAGGEYLGIVDAGGVVIDALAPKYPPQSPRNSYGRDATGSFVYFSRATPGAANPAAGVSSLLAAPAGSPAGGFHAAGVTVALTSPDAGSTIRYTLDGSAPSASHGFTYTTMLTLNTSTVVRAVALRDGAGPSPVVTHTYLIGQSAARRGLAALCISGDGDQVFYGPNAGGGPAAGHGVLAIKGGRYVAAEVEDKWEANGDPAAYNMPMQRGRAFEKQAALEVFPVTGAGLRTDFGLRFAGSDWSRPRMRLTDPVNGRFNPWSGTDKPSFNLYFRSDFGSRPVNYAFVPDNPVASFEDIRLRAGKNDMVDPFITDEFMRRTLLATGQKSSRGTFVTLYVNGVFKGFYNLCERIRDEFMRQHHGGSADWDVRQMNDIESGDGVAWGRMMAFLQSADLTNLAQYAQVHDHLDVDNIIDYLLTNTFAATWDWPLNNWAAARERTPQGRWRLYMWDAEGAFGIYGRRQPGLHDSFIGDADGDGIPETADQNYPLDIGAEARTTSWQSVPALYTLLKASPEFRLRWADRAQKHFFHGGALTPETMEALWVSLRDAVQPIIREETGVTIDDRIRRDWLASPVRRDALFAQMRRYGLWVDTLAPEFSQHGGEIAAGTTIAITHANASGAIYYTLDGTDPRAPGGAIAGTAYTAAPELIRSTVLKARVLASSGEWSPLQEAVFTVEDTSRLLVTELMYDPVGGDGYEFIELKNVGSGTAYLDGAAFVEGITFTFPDGTTVAPGAHIVVARTPATFATRHPGVATPALGYTGKLANEGERVTLRAADGRTLVSVAYGTAAPWPVEPAGGGYSLVPVDPDANAAPDEPASWRASTLVHGSPGLDDPLPEPPAFTVGPAHWKAGDGQSTSLSVQVGGIPPPAVRWQISRDGGLTWIDLVDDGTFSGTASSTLQIADADTTLSGVQFRCIAGNDIGPAVVSAPAMLTIVPPSRLANFSTRAQVLPADGLVIAGLVIRGTSPARMLVRAIGPRLHDMGVEAPLPDPHLEVHRTVGTTSTLVATNDDWTETADLDELLATSRAIGAFSIGDADSTSSALILELEPGNYTAQARGAPGPVDAATGVVLVEFYDLSADRNTLANLSSRGIVGRSEQVMIPGFVVQGEAPQAFLIRAVGPGLARFSVPDLLADPRIRVVRTGQGDVAANDDWGQASAADEIAATAASIGAFALAPDSKDAALLVSLAPGIYTVVVAGGTDEAGIALVEIYSVP